MPNIGEELDGLTGLEYENKLSSFIYDVRNSLPSIVRAYALFGEDRVFPTLDYSLALECGLICDDDFDNQREDEWDKEMERDSDEDNYHPDGRKYLEQLFLAGFRYEYLRQAREIVNLIAKSRREQIRLPYSMSLKANCLSISFGNLYIDKSDVIRFSPPPIARILDGVEADRIRECEVCQKFFWAGRIDQKACTTKCAKVLRSRRWREKYLTNYKLRRIEKESKQDTESKQPKE